MPDPRLPLRGADALSALTRWFLRWGIRLASLVSLLGGLALEAYGRRLHLLPARVIGLIGAAMGAAGLLWVFHDRHAKKPWTMPVPTDPRLPIDCPSCELPLEHLSTTRGMEGEIHVYQCSKHGRFRLDAEGLKPELL